MGSFFNMFNYIEANSSSNNASILNIGQIIEDNSVGMSENLLNRDLDNIPANKSAKGFSELLLQDAVEFTVQVENGSWIGMMENQMNKSG